MDVVTARAGAPDRRRIPAAHAAATLAAVFVLCVSSVVFAPPGSSVAAWWPATGLAAGVLCLTPWRQWPVALVLFGVVAGLGNLAAGRETPVAAVFGVANVVECLVVAVLLGATRVCPTLRTPHDLGRLVVAVVGGALTSALCIATTAALALDGSFLLVLAQVTASHTASGLLIVPVLLLRRDPLAHDPIVASVPARGALATLTLGSVLGVFAGHQSIALALVPFALLVVSAQFLSLRETAAQSLTAGVLVTVLTAHGGGPFTSDALSPALVAALVQINLVVIALVALPVGLAVAQRRQALAAALGSRDTYRRGIAASVTGVMLVRPTAQGLLVLEANEPACQLLDAEPDELVGQPWTAGLGRHQLEIDHAVEEMLRGRIATFETEFWTTGANPHCVRAALSWVPDTTEGNLIVAQLIDLTEGRLAQRALEAERDFTRALLSATRGAAIIATDAVGTITYVNTGAAQVMGNDVRTLLGAPLTTLYTRDELDALHLESGAHDFDAVVDASRRTGADVRRESTWLTVTGRSVRVVSHISPLRGPDQAIIGFLLVATDISAHEQEQSLLRDTLAREREAMTQLEELDVLRASLYTTVSHELRTPLTSIIGFTELLVDDLVPAEAPRQHEMLLRIDRSSRRLLGLIENVLVASRIDARGSRPERTPVDLAAVARRAAMGVEHLTWDRLLQVRGSYGDQPVVVLGDADGLERIVTNLLSNAIKFTPDGGRVSVRVTVDESGRLDETGQAVLTVADTGVGIEAADQERLFDRFFRASSGDRAAVQGTGLGLSIVRDLVEEHDGTVGVTSAPGEGTTIVVCLPLHRVARPVVPVAQPVLQPPVVPVVQPVAAAPVAVPRPRAGGPSAARDRRTTPVATQARHHEREHQ